MANFSAVLRKTIDGLANPTPAMRQRVYEKARATIEQKLSAANARPEAAERQRKILSEAIDEVAHFGALLMAYVAVWYCALIDGVWHHRRCSIESAAPRTALECLVPIAGLTLERL